MKKVTNLIIIDASGSMKPKQEEVKGGLKALFKSIRENELDTTTIVVDFSSHDDIRTLVNTNDKKLLSESVCDEYSTRSWTALYDAIYYAFKLVPKKQDGVFVSILTDGEENDSKKVTDTVIRDLITKKKKKNWVVTFMGTDEKCLDNAVSIGISRGNTMTYVNSASGTATAMTTINETMSYFGSAVSTSATLDADNIFKYSTSLANV